MTNSLSDIDISPYETIRVNLINDLKGNCPTLSINSSLIQPSTLTFVVIVENARVVPASNGSRDFCSYSYDRDYAYKVIKENHPEVTFVELEDVWGMDRLRITYKISDDHILTKDKNRLKELQYEKELKHQSIINERSAHCEKKTKPLIPTSRGNDSTTDVSLLEPIRPIILSNGEPSTFSSYLKLGEERGSPNFVNFIKTSMESHPDKENGIINTEEVEMLQLLETMR